jgi:UDP-3-O-[3-hydroxymyristoyl] glucosamine N-acyltransferase
MIKFNRFDFFPKINDLSLNDIFDILGNEILLQRIKNDSIIVKDISSSINLLNNSILFLMEKLKINDNSIFENILIITNDKSIFDDKNYSNIILVKNSNQSISKIINKFLIHDDLIKYHDDFSYVDGSYISKYSNIHPSSKIFQNSIIGKGVSIGKKSIIKNNVVIKNCIIGENVIISDNTTIGSTGFGFDLKYLGAKNLIPQVGIVVIDDNVHIGSNCTIDRAKIDYTFIGKNSCIDNMVHVAHNVIIHENACIAAQTGISGSTKIGKNLICGGQVGFAGHISVGDNVIVAAKSGVTKNIPDNSTIAGFPAIDIKEWKKQIINQKKHGHK